jgi:hypothetical protein
MNISKLLDKIATPFKWLGAKKIRWLPLVCVFTLIFVTLEAIFVFSLVNHIGGDPTNDGFIAVINQIDAEQQEKAKIGKLKIDLVKYRELWNSSNISDCRIFFSVWNSDNPQISSYDTSDRMLIIQVEDNKITDLKKLNEKNVNYASDIGNFDLVTSLFNIIQDSLDQKPNEEVIHFFDNIFPGMVSGISLKSPPALTYINVDFNTDLGYPELIIIGYGSKNYLKISSQYVQYKIEYFKYSLQ